MWRGRSRSIVSLVVVLVLSVGMAASSAGGETVYVKEGGTGGGTSWADAYGDLQDALDAAAGDPNQIWVAEGTYKPGTSRTDSFQMINGVGIYGGFSSSGDPVWEDRDPNTYITILNGDLLGNDNPATPVENLLDDPSRAENSYHVVTGSGTDATAILDGFIITAGNANGPSGSEQSYGGGMYNYFGNPTLNDCTFSKNSAGRGGGGMYNSYSNLTITGCSFLENLSHDLLHDPLLICGGGMYNYHSSPTVTGCTFSGNSANGAYPHFTKGGGMFNYSSSPTVTDCTFTGNLASRGGGMSNYYNSHPTVTGCTFSDNSGDEGSGMNNESGSHATVTGCIFAGNSGDKGGGMSNRDLSDPEVTGCTFSGNNGGGMFNWFYSSPRVTGCTFTGNSPGWFDGGGMCNHFSSPRVTGCTFSGNNGGGMYNYGSSPIVTNCILWGNTASSGGNEIALRNSSTIDVDYCDVQGGQAGIYDDGSGNTINWDTGNIDADPLFVDSGQWDPNDTPGDPNDDFWVEGDYHLQSEGWRWDSLRQRWDYNEVTSRCIDAGNPGCQLGGELLIIPDDPTNEWGENIRVNMGAYGGTAEASMGPYDWTLLGDLTNDGTVNMEDFAGQGQYWLLSGSELPGDLSRDGTVDIADLSGLVAEWLEETIWH